MDIHNFNYFKFLGNFLSENRLVNEDPKKDLLDGKAKKEVEKKAPPTPDEKKAALKKDLDKKGGKKAAKLSAKAQIELDAKRRRVAEKRETKKAATAEEVKKSIAEFKGIAKLKASRRSEVFTVDPKSLDVSNEGGLDHVVKVFEKVGMNPRDVAFMKTQLERAFQPRHVQGRPDLYNTQLLQNPDTPGNLDKIKKEFADIENFDLFLLALEYYWTVKDFLVRQKDQHLRLKENTQKMDEDPIFTKAWDHLKDAGNRLQEAYDEGDWPTVGMYAVGFYAFYKLYKKYSEKNSKFKDALIWGAAIYCGANILAPDVAKKVFGGGVHADIKGTALEHLDNLGILKEAKEMTTAVIVAPARVKDMFGPLKTDKLSADHQMIQLNNPGIAHLFPGLSHLGPLYPGSKDHFSTEEKLYIETSKILYRNALGLKAAWRQHIQPEDPSHDFDTVFMSNLSRDYTLEHLYNALQDFASNRVEIPWDSPLRDMAAKDLEKVFAKDDLLLDQDPVGNNLEAKIKGCPVVIRLHTDPSSPRKKMYKIFPAHKAGPGNEAVATIDVNDPNSVTLGRDQVIYALDKRMNDFIKRLRVSDSTAKRDIVYDQGVWKATIRLSGDDEYKRSATDEVFIVEPYDDFSGIHGELVGGGGFIEINEKLAKDDFRAMGVLQDLMNQDDLLPLNVFYRARQVTFKDYPENDGRFKLTFAGKYDVDFRFDESTGKFEVDDPTALSNLIQTPDFKEAYVEARAESSEFDVFGQMIDYVQENMDQNYHIYFIKGFAHWFTGATWDKPWAGVSSDLFSGSIPHYYTYTLIEAKKAQLLGILRNNLNSCKTLEDIGKAEEDMKRRLIQIENFYENVLTEEAPAKGKTWRREEYNAKILSTLKNAGLDSNRYRSAFRRVESAVINEVASGGSDLNENGHALAGKILAVFSFYTSHLDDASLDNLTSTGTLPKETRLKDRYFAYVEKRVLKRGKFFIGRYGGKPENLPSPQVRDKDGWDILTYDEWLKDPRFKDARELEPIEMTDRLEHNPRSEELSPLEIDLYTRLEDAYNSILNNPDDGIVNTAELSSYWAQDYAPRTKGQQFYDKVREKTITYEGRVKDPHQLRQIADDIYATCSTYKEQDAAMNAAVREFKMFIAKHDEMFKIKGLNLLERAKKIGLDIIN